jgi:hypothetical protein
MLPHTPLQAGGQKPDGLLQKMMAIIGSGGKALKFYVFGTVRVFRQKFALEDAIGSHAFAPPLEALTCV